VQSSAVVFFIFIFLILLISPERLMAFTKIRARVKKKYDLAFHRLSSEP